MGYAIDYARWYAERSLDLAMSGPGSADRAFGELEKYGVRRRTVEHIRSGRAKTVCGDVLVALRTAYLDLCARKIRTLQHEIAVEEARGRDDFKDLESALVVLSEEISRRRGIS